MVIATGTNGKKCNECGTYYEVCITKNGREELAHCICGESK